MLVTMEFCSNNLNINLFAVKIPKLPKQSHYVKVKVPLKASDIQEII